MSLLKFNFDNSKDLGSIDEYIVEKIYNEKKELYRAKLNIQRDMIIDVFEHKKNNLPLVLNEAKKLLNVAYIGYNIVTIEGKKYLAYESLNNIPLKDYKVDIKNNFLKYNIQKIFVINYLLCVKFNYENKIFAFSRHFNPYVIDMSVSKNVIFNSVNEKFFPYDITKYEIPDTILNKYFNGSLEIFRKIAKRIVNEIDAEAFKQEILTIARKHDDKCVNWTNSVYDMFIRAKGF
jgi:hypothetical protein